MRKNIFTLFLLGACLLLQGCGGMFVQKSYVSSDIPFIANIARDTLMAATDTLCNNREAKYRKASVGGGALGVRTKYAQTCATK